MMMQFLAQYRPAAIVLIVALLAITVALPVVQGACAGDGREAACGDCCDCCRHATPATPGSPAVGDAGCCCAFVPADAPGPEGTPSQTPVGEQQAGLCSLPLALWPSSSVTDAVPGILPPDGRTLSSPDIPLRNSSLLL